MEAAAAAAAAAAAVSGGGGRKPLVLFTYLDAQEHLPYADDSTAVTPKSELNGGIVVDTPTRIGMARKLSYNSHTGKSGLSVSQMKPISHLYVFSTSAEKWTFFLAGKLVDNSYNSHTDLRYPPGSGGGGLCSASGSTKEGILTKRMATLFNDGIKTTSSPNSIVLEPISDHHRSYENESGNNFLRNGKDSVDLQVRVKNQTFRTLS